MLRPKGIAPNSGGGGGWRCGGCGRGAGTTAEGGGRFTLRGGKAYFGRKAKKHRYLFWGEVRTAVSRSRALLPYYPVKSHWPFHSEPF